MNKRKMHSRNLVQENMARIRELFPHCVTEAKGDGGKVKLAVDFDLLRQELSESIVEGPQERYHLNWPGKRAALLAANAPIAKTLRPCREESVDFDTTQNLFIEGDNLDALKLLQETYWGKVKMIYIDPPYNTGNDFIYEDNFAENAESFFKRSNQKDTDGNRLVTNTEAHGRFHSNWLSMMYPRLKLARNLLKSDGIIFISIDDCEFSSLKKICDEVFGAINHYCTFVWKRRSGAMDAVNNVSLDHEYILCYGKEPGKLAGIERTYEKYSNPDNDLRGPWIADNLSAGKPGGNTYYPIIEPETGNEYWPPKGRYWPYSPETMENKIQEGRVIFPKTKGGSPLLKRFQYEAKSDTLPVSTWGTDQKSAVSNSFITAFNTEGTKEIKKLFENKIFTFPKPTQLLRSLLAQGCSSDGVVLDFFAGSATTADAVFQLNAEDGGNRKFILVQLPEHCDQSSEAFKLGFKTISDIGKERIRRSGIAILSNAVHKNWQKDIGFRVVKVDSTSMRDVYYTPDSLAQKELSLFSENIQSDRTDEDILFQVVIDWGLDVSLPIKRREIVGKKVFFLGSDALVACFERGITEELVHLLASYKPLRIVFRDSGFTSDSVKINTVHIFKHISPATEVKIL